MTDLVVQMKLFVKLMIAALFIALLLPFTLLKDDDGDTLMSFSDFGLPDISMPNISMPDLPDFSGSKKITPSSDDDLSGKDIFYKWYDSEGNIQFTTEPPPDGIEYTRKGFDPNANVIQAVKIPPREPTAEDPKPGQANSAGPGDEVNSYSADNIKKLFEKTENIEKLLNQRAKDQESALNQ
jgi:hypothetical protein